MTRYNQPEDASLLGLISDLRARIVKLETRNKSAAISVFTPIKMTDYNAAVVVNSASYVDTHIFPGVFRASTPIVYITVVCSDSTTTGDFRLVDISGDLLTGIDNTLVAPVLIPVGTTTETSFSSAQDNDYWDDLPIGTDRTIKLQVRRTAGAGTISVKARYLTQVPG
jgi:hypothetical protein